MKIHATYREGNCKSPAIVAAFFLFVFKRDNY